MNAGSFPPSSLEVAQRMLSQFGRVGATRIYAAPALGAVIAAGSGVIATAQPITFREPGTVLAAYGQELTGTPAKFASTAVRVQIGGTEDLFTDGQAGTFVPMLALFGTTQNWFPIMRRAQPGVDWTVSYQNNDAGGTASPFFCLAFIADRDVAGKR
jgi:hypothetical protein